MTNLLLVRMLGSCFCLDAVSSFNHHMLSDWAREVQSWVIYLADLWLLFWVIGVLCGRKCRRRLAFAARSSQDHGRPPACSVALRESIDANS